MRRRDVVTTQGPTDALDAMRRPSAVRALAAGAGNWGFAAQVARTRFQPDRGGDAQCEAAPEDQATQGALRDVVRARTAEPSGRLLARQPAAATEQMDYATARVWLKLHLGDCPRVLQRHQPSTGAGMFDVEYAPPQLTIVVKVRFAPGAGWAPHEWAATEREYMKKWGDAVRSIWKPGLFTFYCQTPGWEDLRATVNPVFRPVEKDEHFICRVSKIPEDEADEHQSTIDQQKKQGEFGHTDYKFRDKKGNWQRTSVHEAGHMLGLDEEYVRGGLAKTNIKAKHSKLAEEQLGTPVYLGKSASVMSGGERVLPQHSVTMREALEKVSWITAWGLQPKQPAMAPPGPQPAPGAPAPTSSGPR